MCVCWLYIQEQYKYCFKVLWDYSKYKSKKDETTNDQRIRRSTSSPSNDDDGSTRCRPSNIATNSEETRSSTEARVAGQTHRQSFTAAFVAQNMKATHRRPAPLSKSGEIELSSSGVSSAVAWL